MLNLPQVFTLESKDLLVSILERVFSSNNRLSYDEEMELIKAETNPGYLLLLQYISTDPTVQSHTQLSSLICLKNAINRNWRSSSQSLNGRTLSNEDRTELKQRLLLQIQKPLSSSLSIHHIGTILAKISRYEWPSSFNELFEVLLSCLNQNDIQLQTQSLIILYSVISEHASKCLPMARKAFYALSLQLYPLLISLLTNFMNTIQTSTYEVIQSMEMYVSKILHYISKCLFKVVYYGILNKDPSLFNQYIQVYLQYISSYFVFYKQFSSSYKHEIESCIKWQTRVILETVKTHLELYKDSYLDLLSLYTQYLYSLYTNENETDNSNTDIDSPSTSIYIKTFVCSALSFIEFSFQLILSSENSQTSSVNENQSVTLSIQQKLLQYFDNDYIIKLLSNILFYCLRLNKSHIEDYILDPEEYINYTTYNESLDLSISLYKQVIQKYPQITSQYIAKQFEQIQTLFQYNSIDSILYIDYNYQLLSYSSHIEQFNQSFDSYWYTSYIHPVFEMYSTICNNNESKYFNVLICRCLNVLTDYKQYLTTPIYEDLFHYIHSFFTSNDIILQYYTISTILTLSTEINFPKESFYNLYSEYIQCILHLIQIFSTPSSITILYDSIYNSLSLYTIHGNTAYDSILNNIALLFNKNDHMNNITHYQFKTISILTKVLTYVKEISPEVSASILSLLYIVLHIDSYNQTVSLLEESLSLFKEFFSHITTYTYELHQLFPYLHQYIVDNITNSIYIQHYIDIIERYILLGGEQFLNSYFMLFYNFLNQNQNQFTKKIQSTIFLLYMLILTLYPNYYEQLNPLLISISNYFIQNSSLSSYSISDVSSILLLVSFIVFNEFRSHNSQQFILLLSQSTNNSMNDSQYITQLLSVVLAIYDQLGSGLYFYIKKEIVIRFFTFCLSYYLNQMIPYLPQIFDCIDSYYTQGSSIQERIEKYKQTMTNLYTKLYYNQYIVKVIEMCNWNESLNQCIQYIQQQLSPEQFKQYFISLQSIYISNSFH